MPTFSFDVNEAAPRVSKSFEPLPRGLYDAMIIETAIKPTKRGDGEYLACTFEIIDGPHAGRRLWQNLNLSNPNKQAEDIAREELNNICAAIGIPKGTKLSNTEQLHDVPLVVDVGIDAKDTTRNRIFAYVQKSASSTPTTAKADNNKKPWEK
jgi:hypothetical protein